MPLILSDTGYHGYPRLLFSLKESENQLIAAASIVAKVHAGCSYAKMDAVIPGYLLRHNIKDIARRMHKNGSIPWPFNHSSIEFFTYHT